MDMPLDLRAKHLSALARMAIDEANSPMSSEGTSGTLALILASIAEDAAKLASSLAAKAAAAAPPRKAAATPVCQVFDLAAYRVMRRP